MEAQEQAAAWPNFTIDDTATAEQREVLERFQAISTSNPGVLLNALSILSMHRDTLSISKSRMGGDIVETVDTVRTLLDTRADLCMIIDPETEAEIHRDPVVAGLRQQQGNINASALISKNTDFKERLRDQFRLRNLAVFAGRAVIAQSIAAEATAEKQSA